MSELNTKEKRIAELLRQGKSWNFIMKGEHCGPQTIKKVKVSITPATRSARSQAFEMLENGSTLYEIALNLDISSEAAINYQKEYLELKGKDEIVGLLKDKQIEDLIPISRQIKERGLTVDQIDRIFREYVTVSRLEKQEWELSASLQIKQTNYVRLCEEESKIIKNMEDLKKQNFLLSKQKDILEATVRAKELALEKILNDKELNNLEQDVLEMAESIIEDKKILLCAAANAVVRTICANPQFVNFFSDPRNEETIARLFLDPGSPEYENEIFRLAKSNLADSADFLAQSIVLAQTINCSTEKLSAEITQIMALRKHSPALARLFKV